MSRRRLQFGFDLLGNKVYAFRGGAVVDEKLLAPLSKEEVTEEFERALAIYVGCGGNGSRLIQFEDGGELLTFEVSVKQVETARRFRERKNKRLEEVSALRGEATFGLVLMLFAIIVITFFLIRIIPFNTSSL